MIYENNSKLTIDSGIFVYLIRIYAKSSKRTFFNPNIMVELDKHYSKKKQGP